MIIIIINLKNKKSEMFRLKFLAQQKLCMLIVKYINSD